MTIRPQLRRGLALVAIATVLLGATTATSASAATPQAPKPPQLSWSPTTATGTFSLGSHVLTGQPVTQSFTLTNKGKKLSGIIAGLLAGGSSAFTLSANACEGVTLKKKQACTVTATWSPTDYGQSDSATLSAHAVTGKGRRMRTISATLTATASTPTGCTPVAVLNPSSSPVDAGPLALDATQSTDPCGSAVPLVYIWQCTSIRAQDECTAIEEAAVAGTLTTYTLNVPTGTTFNIFLTVCTAYPPPPDNCSQTVDEEYSGIAVPPS